MEKERKEPAAVRTLCGRADGGTEVKRSKFIAEVVPVHTEEEAQAVIAAARKKYWDARHHCFAFVLGERGEILRSSDDGEPQGTAGHPMLDVLTGEGLTDVCAVVTRYFGGTLLGTGGLVRAYSGALRDALSRAVIKERRSGVRIEVCTDYTYIGKIQYYMQQKQLPILSPEYGADVKFHTLLSADQEDTFRRNMAEMTGGAARLSPSVRAVYSAVDGRIEEDG